MTNRTKLWLVPAALYAVFFLWYTDLGGPLSEEEIADYVARVEAQGGDPGMVAVIKSFGGSDTGRQFIMVNNIDLNENPPNVEGATPGESATELLARYMEYMYPALLSRASHPVFGGPVVFRSMDIVGIENAEHWDQGALMRYRSRRTMLDIVTNPAFQGRHDFKTAGLTKTIAYPVEPQLYLGDPRLLLALLLIAITALIDAQLARRTLAKQHQ